MPTPVFAESFPELSGRRVLVIGAGKSGRAAAKLALEHGAQVTIADRLESARLQRRFEGWEVALHGGGHPASLADTTDLIVMSPGVPTDIELITVARERGIPVWSEIELAWRFCHGRVVGITGSNGKSTVTAFVGHLLRHARIPGGTGGNLDTPFAELLSHDSEEAVHAIELSSFQLETIDRFRPNVGLLLNLAADHLDRHGSLEAYAAAKARLFENLSDNDAAILNADDDASRRFDAAAGENVHTFSTAAEIQCGAFVCDGWVTLRTKHGEERICPVDAIPLPGEHNLSNTLAAVLCARLCGVDPERLRSGISTFRALDHRLEKVTTVNGVDYYNDSKATNPAASLPALRAFPKGTVHLIVGGKDKGGDWPHLAESVATQQARLYVIGEEPEPVAAHFATHEALQLCGTMERAVHAATEAAQAGDTVLLSPACASFDQYENFEDRGRHFRAVARALGGGDA